MLGSYLLAMLAVATLAAIWLVIQLAEQRLAGGEGIEGRRGAHCGGCGGCAGEALGHTTRAEEEER